MTTEFFSAEIQCDRLLIDAELHRILVDERPCFGQSVYQCMSYSIFSGGKRMRPLLGLQVARALACNPLDCLTHLAAVEILHSASLIIDDLPCMDNALFRRSRPSAHRQFGEQIAILAAIAMITLAINLAESESATSNAASVRQFRRMLLDAFGRGGLISGQEADLAHKGLSSALYTKTTPLFELSCAAGLISANLAAAQRVQIIAFGRNFGRAFQAIDDFEDGGDRYAPSAFIELSQCSETLTALEDTCPEFKRLREFISFLETKRPAGFEVAQK
jgi:geranylgeranyl diphosphate synthase, type II